MALDISFDQFNRIASGTYNAGQIDFRTKKTRTNSTSTYKAITAQLCNLSPRGV